MHLRLSRNRMDHLVLGICASCPYADTETRKGINNWPQEVLQDLQEARLTLPTKYLNFNPRETGGGKMYSREEGLRRVRMMKKKYEPGNLFAICKPDLGS